MMEAPRKDVHDPVTTAGAIIGIKYEGGIILASDRVLSYGKSLKFQNVTHFEKLASNVIIGASGEYADFQELCDILTSYVRKHECTNDGKSLKPSEIYTVIKRYMYQRRSKMKPLLLKVLIAGIEPDGKSFLATSDEYGTSWEDDYICTGCAAHLKALQLDEAVNRSKDTVIDALKVVWKAISRRYALSNENVELFDVSPGGIERIGEIQIECGWEYVEGTGYELTVEL
jgi:20S proteasome subunit beta 7